ncbi:LOW QUALITY PROTEIN: hypothetical protein OSB04_002446, partial [Centaurea solstitialis]
MILKAQSEGGPYLFTKAKKSKKWREAMVTKIRAIENNDTWELANLSKGVKPIAWVFKTKIDERGEVQKFKTLLVAKGYAQSYRVDCTEVLHSATGIFICHGRYTKDIIARFGMKNSNPVNNPIVLETLLSKDKSSDEVDATMFKQIHDMPKLLQWLTAKRILRCIKGCFEFAVLYKKEDINGLVPYTDSGQKEEHFWQRIHDGVWSGFMVFQKATVILLRRSLEQLGIVEKQEIIIYCDSSSTIQLSKNPVFYGKSKHVGVRFRFLGELVSDRVVEISSCRLENQLADIITKPLKL